MEAAKIQNQIRNNADEISSYLSDIMKWENSINITKPNSTDSKLTSRRSVKIRESGTIKVKYGLPSSKSLKPADSHTYDKGYKKWENFDVDTAIDEIDDEDEDQNSSISKKSIGLVEPVECSAISQVVTCSPKRVSSQFQTPSSIISTKSINLTATSPAIRVAPARGTANTSDAEQTERERGNLAFKAGNYNEAVKAYTRCLGLKPKNFIAFSNRAMAYLKLKEYSRAEIDCGSALLLDPTHIKSLLRRSTARNATGKHRAALNDLELALVYDPNNKECLSELRRTKELIRACVSKAPFVESVVTWELPDGMDEALLAVVEGPDLPLGNEDSTSYRNIEPLKEQ